MSVVLMMKTLNNKGIYKRSYNIHKLIIVFYFMRPINKYIISTTITITIITIIKVQELL